MSKPKGGWYEYEKCPICGKPWLFGMSQCKCDHGTKDKILQVAATPDIISPVAAMTGIPPGVVLFIVALIGAGAWAVGYAIK